MIPTDGKGLEECLPFLKEHNFRICVSYDGANGDARGFAPFSSPLDCPVVVSCTLYHGNCDLRTIPRNFAQKEQTACKPPSFFPHIVHVTSEGNVPFALTEEDHGFILS